MSVLCRCWRQGTAVSGATMATNPGPGDQSSDNNPLTALKRPQVKATEATRETQPQPPAAASTSDKERRRGTEQKDIQEVQCDGQATMDQIPTVKTVDQRRKSIEKCASGKCASSAGHVGRIQTSTHVLNNHDKVGEGILHPLEVVGRGSDPQLRVGENLDGNCCENKKPTECSGNAAGSIAEVKRRNEDKAEPHLSSTVTSPSRDCEPLMGPSANEGDDEKSHVHTNLGIKSRKKKSKKEKKRVKYKLVVNFHLPCSRSHMKEKCLGKQVVRRQDKIELVDKSRRKADGAVTSSSTCV